MIAAINMETLKLFLQGVTTLAGIAGLIWTIGWAIRGPRLRLSLLDSRGYRTRFGDSPDAPPVYFYHLRVSNKRKWLANNTRVKLIRVTKERKPHGNGEQRAPVYFMWAAKPSPKPYLLDVLGFDEEACNLGFIIQKEGKFQLDVIDPARAGQNFKWPPHFDGFLSAGEEMQLELVTVAENARSNTLRLRISWDSQWCEEASEMQKHLVITTAHAGALEAVRRRLELGA
jgi:hypothetical protein